MRTEIDTLKHAVADLDGYDVAKSEINAALTFMERYVGADQGKRSGATLVLRKALRREMSLARTALGQRLSALAYDFIRRPQDEPERGT